MKRPTQLDMFKAAIPPAETCPRCGEPKQRAWIVCGTCYSDTPIPIRRDCNAPVVETRKIAIRKMISGKY